MEIIQDGIGKGYSAKVDVHNRLYTYSTTIPRISFVSEKHGTSYMVYAQRDITVANDKQALSHLLYTGNVYLYVDKITFSTDDTKTLFEIYVDGVYSTGGSLVTPVNINRNSSISSDVTCYIGVSGSSGELDISRDEADEIMDIRLSSSMPTYTYNFDSALILPKNTSFSIFGSSENVGAKLRASIFYFEEVNINQ